MRKRHSTPAPAVGPNFQKNRPPPFFSVGIDKRNIVCETYRNPIKTYGGTNKQTKRCRKPSNSTRNSHPRRDITTRRNPTSLQFATIPPPAPIHAQCGRRLALVRRRQEERKRKRFFMTRATAMRKVRTSVRYTQTMPNSSVIDKRI